MRRAALCPMCGVARAMALTICASPRPSEFAAPSRWSASLERAQEEAYDGRQDLNPSLQLGQLTRASMSSGS